MSFLPAKWKETLLNIIKVELWKFAVKPDVLLMGTLQRCGEMFYYSPIIFLDYIDSQFARRNFQFIFAPASFQVPVFILPYKMR